MTLTFSRLDQAESPQTFLAFLPGVIHSGSSQYGMELYGRHACPAQPPARSHVLRLRFIQVVPSWATEAVEPTHTEKRFYR